LRLLSKRSFDVFATGCECCRSVASTASQLVAGVVSRVVTGA